MVGIVFFKSFCLLGMFHNSQRQGGTELCLNAEAAMTGHREQEPDRLPGPPAWSDFRRPFLLKSPWI